MCLYVHLMWIYVQENIYFTWTFTYNLNFYMTCILMRMHVFLCTRVRIHCLCGHACLRRVQIVLFYLFHNLCQPLYMFTMVPEIHGWRCAIRVGESVIRVLRNGLCVGLFYCFNDAVCFIFMYLVRNDEIKQNVNHQHTHADNKLPKIGMFWQVSVIIFISNCLWGTGDTHLDKNTTPALWYLREKRPFWLI